MEELFKFYRKIEERWELIRPHLGIIAVLILLTIIVCRYYYADRIDAFKEQIVILKEDVERYKNLAGVTTPQHTALSGLSNAALKDKGRLLVRKLRQIHEAHAENLSKISPKEEGGMDRWQRENARADRQMEEIRIDTLITIEAMRDRLPPEIRERVITTIPHIRPENPGDPVLLWRFLRFAPGVLSGFADQIADEIEELGKLLPNAGSS
jgi:hypothetical protein